jgi:hypothetical protein
MTISRTVSALFYVLHTLPLYRSRLMSRIGFAPDFCGRNGGDSLIASGCGASGGVPCRRKSPLPQAEFGDPGQECSHHLRGCVMGKPPGAARASTRTSALDMKQW